ncbi:hypothetical protein BC829DRAFT_77100 [Chytridium lagenaria]|nr:hypothetical protein BC829DRAFT_77100 [Chytridium lagenaria]
MSGKLGLIGWWTFLAKVPIVGNWIFNALVAFSSPYTGSVPLAFKSLTVGKCVGTMRERRAIRNPFMSVHAAALINMGEAVGGMSVLTWIEDQPKPLRAIVVNLTGTYSKKARGLLTATAHVTDDMMNKAIADGQINVVTEIKDAAGDVVAEISALWKISEAPPKPSQKIKAN